MATPARLYASQKDVDHLKAMDYEHFYLHYERVAIYSIVETQELNLYGQPTSLSKEMIEALSEIPAYINLDPEEQEMSNMGLDHKEVGTILFSVAVCEALEYTPQIGDRFRWQGHSFELRTVKPEGHILNTEQFIHYLATFNKNKTNSSIDNAT